MMEDKINKIIQFIGSMQSLIIHTIIFALSLSLYFLNIFDFNDVLLFLTTVVSLEAIYLSILIQMSVNIQSKKLNTVASNVVELQKDVEEIQENVEDIQENVEDIQEDVEDIQEELEIDTDEDKEMIIELIEDTKEEDIIEYEKAIFIIDNMINELTDLKKKLKIN